MTENSDQYIEKMNISRFQEDLIDWFQQEQRLLPWRESKDPYKIWVSEVMLQQTKVETVIPYYKRFLELFPTPGSLAEAEEEKVLKAWEGLGYYSRARNLQAAVKEVVEQYDGRIPKSISDFSSLKGVGPYTAGAVMSIAYNMPEPAVDGNVMRVMSRILSIWDDIAKPKTRKVFEKVVSEVISSENPSDFNQALMELGALICTPKSPSCLLCPVREHCHAFQEGVQKELPVKSKKKPPKPLEIGAAVLWNRDGEVLIHKRPAEGLLANLWEFPNHETVPGTIIQKDQLLGYLEQEFDVRADIHSYQTSIKHVFSHLVWNISVYEGIVEEKMEEKEELKFVSVEAIKQYPFPVSHQKIMKELVIKEDE